MADGEAPGSTMEMHQVRYFLAVARTLNFTRAADECNVTQPSLTRAVQKLEDEFGGQLFRRERALTHLTDLGRSMLPHLERTFEAAQAAKSLAKGFGKAQVAPLNVGIATSVETARLREVLGEVGTGVAGLELSIAGGASAALVDAALQGDLDLVVVEAPEPPPDRWEAWPLFDQDYVMLVHAESALAGHEAASLGELREQVWIDCGTDGAARLRRATEPHGYQPDFRHRADGSARARDLARAGLGGTVALSRDAEQGLAAVPFADDGFTAPVVVASIAGRRRSPAAEAFLRACRARDWRDDVVAGTGAKVAA